MDGKAVYDHMHISLRHSPCYLLHEGTEVSAVPTVSIIEQPFPGVRHQSTKEPDISSPAIVGVVMRPMPSIEPSPPGRIELGGNWTFLVHTYHRALCWRGGIELDSTPFSWYSGSVLSSQERLRCHQRMPSSCRIFHRRVRPTSIPSLCSSSPAYQNIQRTAHLWSFSEWPPQRRF
jgi:hypothetical protein